MRAIMLKNNYAPAHPLAYVVNRVVPGIESYGGVVNLPVGGINMAAVEQAVRFKGGYLAWFGCPLSTPKTRSVPPSRRRMVKKLHATLE